MKVTFKTLCEQFGLYFLRPGILPMHRHSDLHVVALASKDIARCIVRLAQNCSKEVESDKLIPDLRVAEYLDSVSWACRMLADQIREEGE